MQAIINFFKRAFEIIRRFLKQVKHPFLKILAFILIVVKRGTFALPQDETEKLQILESIYKTLNLVLVLAVLCTGVWLSEHGYPSWIALMLFALRLLYALPAKRVERALRKHQVQDRQNVRAARHP